MMYVRWKILFGLGAIFWTSLCLYDAYFINPTTKFFYSDTDEYEWLAQVSQEEILEEESHPIRDDITFPFEGYNFGVSMLLWNLVAFVVTIIVCTIGKFSLVYLMELQAQYRTKQLSIREALENSLSRKAASSKIPVFTPSRTSLSLRENLNETIEKGSLVESSASLISSSSTSMDVHVRSSKSEMSSRLEQQMEKQCAKLRDEMIVVQANSLKEHAALSRKLESVSREKRDLYRQLMITQKENRAAKEQLEELLSEKALLVKRLECASKEFKMNTKSKKVALANLEESQVTIISLKQELERISHEKENLENKFKILDSEHRNLKERLAKYEPPTPDSINTKLDNNRDNLESKIGFTVSNDVKRSHLIEISQSQKDVQRVQLRLMNLEKSLDRLKHSSWDKTDEKKKTPGSTPRSTSAVQGHTDTDEFDNFVASITTRAESPLEGQVNKAVKELLVGSDNLTDEERRRILDPTESSGDEYASISKNHNCFMERAEDPFERVGNLLNYVKHSPSSATERPHVSGLEAIIPNNETTTSATEDDTDDWEPPLTRIVSNSPAFQKFLKRMDPLDRTHINFTE